VLSLLPLRPEDDAMEFLVSLQCGERTALSPLATNVSATELGLSTGLERSNAAHLEESARWLAIACAASRGDLEAIDLYEDVVVA
jgi:hypothetical protein